MGRAKKEKKEKMYIPQLRKLFTFQKELIDNSKKNYMYITDTGTGKSLMAIHHYLKYKGNEDIKLIIVAPSQKVKEKGWEREIKNVEFSENVKINEYEIISYSEITKRVKPILNMKVKKGERVLFKRKEALKELFSNCFFIIDECHFIKNKTSQRTKSLLNVLKQANGWCLLSATPYPNGYIDMGVYLSIAGFYESPFWYEEKHATYDKGLLVNKGARVPMREPETWKNREIIDERFKSIASKPLKKEECLDLPKLFKIKNLFEKSKEYKALEELFDTMLVKFSKPIDLTDWIEVQNEVVNYEDYSSYEEYQEALEESKSFIERTTHILNDDMKELEKNISAFKIADIEEKIKAKRDKVLSKKNIDVFEENFWYQIDEELNSVPKIFYLARAYTNPLEKAEYLSEFLEGTENNVLVFYNFDIEKEVILDTINSNEELKNKTIYQVNGSMNNIPDFSEFNSIKNSVTLVQVQAGGAGIELQYCTEVIYFSPTWSYQDYYQSLGRAYRQGQTKNVNVYEYIVEESVEEYIKSLLDNKKSFDLSMLYKLKFQR